MKISDEQHPFFVSVLENVNTIFRRWNPESSKASDSSQSQSTKIATSVPSSNDSHKPEDIEDKKNVSNIENLGPGSRRAEVPSVKGAVKIDKIRTTSQMSDAEHETEQDFEVLCFLYNLYQLRQRVKYTWSDWILQKIGTMTAATVSDLAMNVAHQRATVLVESLQEHENSRTILDVLNKLHQLVPGGKQQASVSPPDNHELLTREVLCLDTIFLVEKFWRIESEGVGAFQDSPPKESFCLRFLFHSLLIGQSELRLASGLPLDRFTESISSPEIGSRAWLPFGLRILLDIQETLAHSLDLLRYDVVDHAMHILQCLQEHFDYEDEVWGTEEQPDYMTVYEVKWSTQYLPAMEAMMDWTRQLLDQTPETVSGMSNAYFLAVNPILSGRTMWDYHSKFHGDAIGKVQWFIVALAHLYNACRQVGGLEVSWPDLEYIIESQGAARIFVGDRPTDSSLFHKRFALALSTSVREFSKDFRESGEGYEEKRNRGLVSHPALESKIMTYFRTDSRSERSTQLHNLFASLLQDREKLLGNTPRTVPGIESPNGSNSSDEARAIFEAIATKRARDASTKKSRKKNKSKIPDFNKLNSVHADLLSDVVSQLADHELYANFDHLSFSRRANEMVAYIRSRVLWDNSQALIKIDDDDKPPDDFTLLYELFASLKPPRDKTQKRQALLHSDGMEKIKLISIVFKNFIPALGSIGKTNAEEQMRRRRQHDALDSADSSSSSESAPRPDSDLGETAARSSSVEPDAHVDEGIQEDSGEQ